MTLTDRPTVRVSNPTDLLALVPYLLGFHPTSSLVAIALDGSRMLLTARLDLPTLTEDLPQLHAALDRVVATMAAHCATSAILAGYGTAEQVEPTIHAATLALSAASIPVPEALRVDDGRYYSLTCTNPTCCPPAGTPFDPTTSITAATATAAGMVALPDRNAVAARLQPVAGPARDAMVTATITAAQFLLELVDAVAPEAGDDADMSLDTPLGRALLDAGYQYLSQAQQSYQARRPVDDEQAALLSVLLEVPSVRQYAALHTTGNPWQIEMWTDLLRRAEPAFTTAPATLLALAAMQAGNAALADIAVHRALDADPTDGLAQLLANAITAGVDPATVTALLAG